MAPITDCLKKCEFAWSNAAAKAFVEIKVRMVSASVMRLPDFSKIFDVGCDTCSTSIGEVLAHEGHPVAYFYEKLNDAKQKYSTTIMSFIGDSSNSLLVTLFATTRIHSLFCS